MDLLQELKERARTQVPAAFAKDHPGLYLYGRMPGAAAHGFKTPLADLRDLAEERTGGEGELFLLRVEKTGRNSWSRQITVGRANNNDVVLRHASVSKLHAHFSARADGTAEAVRLADDGSSNGTAVNGRDLARGDEAALAVGDRLRFGDVEVRLLDPEGLHRELCRADLVPSGF